MVRRFLRWIDLTTLEWFEGFTRWYRQGMCKHEGTVIGRMKWEEEFAYAYDQCVACEKEWWPDD